jgi:methionyl-tRNA synthetase
MTGEIIYVATPCPWCEAPRNGSKCKACGREFDMSHDLDCPCKKCVKARRGYHLKDARAHVKLAFRHLAKALKSDNRF